MNSILKVVGAAVVAGCSFVVLTPAAGAQVQPTPVASERHHVDCEDLVAANSRRHHHHGHDQGHDDDCGPPPMVPEVPVTVALPLTGAAVGLVAYGVRRRRGTSSPTPAPAA